jgi:hypothetical protein
MSDEISLSDWLASGFEVSLEYPTVDRPTYRASIEEFDLSAEAATLDDAYNAVLDRVVKMVADRLSRGESLPPRQTPQTPQTGG